MQKGKDRRLKTTFDFPLPNKEEEEEYMGGNVERRSR
jgi:hypothetical protein